MKASELRAKPSEELQKLLAEHQAELVEKRRTHAAGELTNPRSITKIRREIALMLTVVNEQSAAKEDK
jgi:ribosomal protein L29